MAILLHLIVWRATLLLFEHCKNILLTANSLRGFLYFFLNINIKKDLQFDGRRPCGIVV
jgi:hypothetical protein